MSANNTGILKIDFETLAADANYVVIVTPTRKCWVDGCELEISEWSNGHYYCKICPKHGLNQNQSASNPPKEVVVRGGSRSSKSEIGAILSALQDLSDSDCQEVYRFLYNRGCRINR